MLEAIGIMINGVWGILCITIPVTSGFSYTTYDNVIKNTGPIQFTLWQYFFAIIFIAVLLKQIMGGVKKND